MLRAFTALPLADTPGVRTDLFRPIVPVGHVTPTTRYRYCGAMSERSRTRSIRADVHAWEILDWYASLLDVPLGSLLRDAVEQAAAEVFERYKDDLDPSLPEGLLWKYLETALELRPRKEVTRTANAN